MWAISNKWDVCRLAKNGTILNFLNNFFYKIKIQRGYIAWKKLTSLVCRALWGGPFWLNACLPTGQIWADHFFNHFELKI